MNEAKANLTLKQRQRLQGKVQSEQKPRGRSDSKELPTIVAILLLLLAFGGGTAFGMYFFRPDPALQEIADMEAIMSDPFTPGDIRGELGGQFRDLAESLPPDVREKAGMGGGGENRIARFFAKTPAEQLAELQARAAREKQWEARRAEMEAQAAADAATKPADSSQANGSGNGNSGNGGPRGGKNEQQRAQRMQQGLANHPPQQRAQFGVMRQMINAVRQQAAAAQ